MEFYFHEVDHGVTIVAVDGGLDSSTARQFKESLEKMVEAGLRKLIIDCRKLHYVSSYGVGVLLRIHSRMAEHGGNVKLAALPGAVFRVLSLMKLDQHFDIYPGLAQAEAAFDPET